MAKGRNLTIEEVGEIANFLQKNSKCVTIPQRLCEFAGKTFGRSTETCRSIYRAMQGKNDLNEIYSAYREYSSPKPQKQPTSEIMSDEDFAEVTRFRNFVAFKEPNGQTAVTFMANDNEWFAATNYKGYNLFLSGGCSLSKYDDVRIATEDEVHRYMMELQVGWRDGNDFDWHNAAFNGLWSHGESFVYKGRFFQNAGVLWCSIIDLLTTAYEAESNEIFSLIKRK